MPDLLERLQEALAGRYSVESEIGRGGMATVYLATDLKHDRQVAVKVIHPAIAATLGTDRFLREIQIAARLEHPHILSLYDSGDADGLPYYVMPFVEGESLEDRLGREGPLPIDEALEIAGEVAEGLDYAHRQGVIHRDIKPGNVLLSEGHALIADFGVGRAIDAASDGDATATGLAVGTPKYMSPEQAAGAARIDGRTDIYALGCVLWEMLAGEPPFDGPTPSAILARKAAAEAPQIRLRRKTVPAQLENVLARSMATEPADRFRTAGEFAAALKAPETVGRVRVRGRRARRLGAAAVAVLLVGAGVWLALAFTTESGPGGNAAIDLDPNRIVVLPFAEPGGSAPEGLSGREVAYLLAIKLGSGVGDFRSVAPTDVVAAIERECGAIADAACGSAVGLSLGASILVMGETVEVGSRLHLSARVHDLAGGETTEPVAVEGDPLEAHLMVDDLAQRLLPGFAGTDAERLFASAPGTTDSLRALKAYFEGAQLIRENSYVDAVEALTKAVEIDSTFALAWYRLALAADWHGDNDLSIRAAAKAPELSGSLPERERRLLEGFHLLKAGESEHAEALFRGILRDYPTDNDARYFLAWVLHFSNWSQGRPVAEALPYLRAVVTDDPGYGPAWEHYVAVLGAAAAWEELDSVVSLPGGEVGQWDILLAATSADTAALERALLDVRSAAGRGALREEVWAGLHLFDASGPNGMARLLLLEPLLPRAWQRRGYPSLAFGKLEEAVGQYREMEEGPVEPYGMHPLLARHWLYTLPFLPFETGRYDVGELDDWLSSEVQNAEDPEVSYWSGLYVKGLLLATRGGEPGRVLEAARELESYAGSDARRIPERFAGGLRAQLYWQRGRLEDALETLEAMPGFREEGSGMHLPIAGGWRELYLRAEILRQLGRLDEAEAWFQHSVGYRFPAESFLKRGEIAEARGNTEQAIEWYGKIVLLWEDADDWLQPRVDEIRARISRLEAGDS